MSPAIQLFMGLFLHQTTTSKRQPCSEPPLFMGLFLHQTTTVRHIFRRPLGCLWVFSYIKPQPVEGGTRYVFVVYGSFPTSNHNGSLGCSSSTRVVYGSFPTSNHNHIGLRVVVAELFMGLFLHQTTTLLHLGKLSLSCLWVFSYIKPQPSRYVQTTAKGCLWVFSYIKPQLQGDRQGSSLVVYGSFPTSNHNYPLCLCPWLPVVYGSFPTSNHNITLPLMRLGVLFMGLFLYQTTT